MVSSLGVAAPPLRVFVSVLPLQTFVEKVGGRHVEVFTLVGPGHNPATYGPTPRQISALAHARLYVRTGVAFEDAWMPRIRAANPDMSVLDARENIDIPAVPRAAHAHDGDSNGDHSSDSPDPHIWTSPLLVKKIALNIRNRLIELDPANRSAYLGNYESFATELDALDVEIRKRLEDIPNRRFMVFHPAWSYFAAAYGLKQVAIEREGKQPGARALTELIRQAEREKVKVIFVQPQFDTKSARQVARAIDGRVVAIDPLAPDYANNLRAVARSIAGESYP
jgi:zinc transport system substrate-binding protein